MEATVRAPVVGVDLPRRIFLVGLSGSGKSTVAPLVAKALDWAAADSDRLIEQRAGRTVAAIFADDGEEAFRSLEAEVLEGLAEEDGVVVATGGGAVTTARGRAALARGFVAWLAVEPSEAAQRLAANPAGEERPLLAGGAMARLTKLQAERAPLYARADVHIALDGESPSEAARLIVDAWEGAAATRVPLADDRLEPE